MHDCTREHCRPCDYVLTDQWGHDGNHRTCGNVGHESLGDMKVCHVHRRIMLSSIWRQVSFGDKKLKKWMEQCLAQADEMALIQIEMEREAAKAQHRAEIAAERALELRELAGRASIPNGSVVYFVEREGFVKIGISTNVDRRIKQISRGSGMIPGMTIGPCRLLTTIPGGRPEEKALHKRFRDLHVDGEWFLLDHPIREFIRSMDRYEEALEAVS